MREFIVEADGGSRGNPGPAGYGSVVIDATTGETLAEAAEYIGIATNNVAEYRGLVAGLRAARELDPAATVHVRMDSKLVVEQMSGRWKIKHPDMKPLAAEAARVFPVAEQVTYEWIPREKNKHADRLANEAMDAGKRGEQWSASTSTAELDAGLSATAADTDTDTGAATKVAVGWSAPADLGPPATFVLLRHGETLLTPRSASRAAVERTRPSRTWAGTRPSGWPPPWPGAARSRRSSPPLTRTRETAAAVAARLGLDVTIDEGLRETDFGAWEGLTFGEVRERYPDDMNAWLADPKAEPTGGGESFAATARRMAVTRDKLIAAHAGRTVLLVTHVTPIKTLVRLALGAPAKSLFRMELSAASLSAVAYYADGNASVRLFNDTSHLR